MANRMSALCKANAQSDHGENAKFVFVKKFCYKRSTKGNNTNEISVAETSHSVTFECL